MDNFLAETLKILLAGIPPLGIIFVLLLFFPEKIEKWSALLWKFLTLFGSLFNFAQKRYIKHDLQGRVNDYVKRLRKAVPGSFNDRLELVWVDPNVKRSALLADGRIILRLRADDPQDHNFVHASYLYVSKCLLKKTKRYLSRPQQDAIEIFVCSKLIKEEKPTIVQFFLDEYLGTIADEPKSKAAALIDDFAIIDRAGYFFPLLIQELEYLGDKVFGKRKDQVIAQEVNKLIDFLRPVAQRKVGDQNDLDFDGIYCKFAIVIVGKPAKLLVSIDPYVNYIKKRLVPKLVDTIYILGKKENQKKLDKICPLLIPHYECVRAKTFEKPVNYDGHTEIVSQYLMVLRRQGSDLIIPSS